jgi:hypothetical protein
VQAFMDRCRLLYCQIFRITATFLQLLNLYHKLVMLWIIKCSFVVWGIFVSEYSQNRVCPHCCDNECRSLLVKPT